MRATSLIAASGLLVLPSSPATAHHSEIAFDMEAVVAFQGVVTDYSWRNPHIYVRVETIEAGQPVEWEIQAGPTPIMSRSGWSEDTFSVGDRVTVRANPERDPERKYAFLETIEKEDGSRFAQTMGQPESGAVAQSIEGRWRLPPESFGPAYEASQQIPLTARGAEILAEYDIYQDSSLLQCQAMPTPITPALVAILYVAEIEIGDDVVYLRSEFYDSERIVYTDGRDHSQSGERTNHGHSIGWWEGESLVVDTTRFSDHASPLQSGVPSGGQKHVVERYTLSEDGTGLIVEIFLEDPEFLAEPYTATVELIYTPNAEMYAYNCEPEVSRQFSLR